MNKSDHFGRESDYRRPPEEHVAVTTAADAFGPLVQQTTPSLIAEQLREGIVTGRVRGGMQLAEGELAKAFGVSRGPIREAMQRLIQEGLLHAERNRGIFVNVLSTADFIDVYLARSAIETAAVKVLVEDAAPDVGRLRRACHEIAIAADIDDRAAVSAADLEFHAALVSAANSPRLTRMHSTLLAETRMCMALLEQTQGKTGDVEKEHLQILRAIEERALNLALTHLDNHMRDGVARLTTSP